MPNADSLNLKTEDDLSVPGTGGKTSKYKTEREESAEEEAHQGFGIIGTIVSYAVRGPL